MSKLASGGDLQSGLPLNTGSSNGYFLGIEKTPQNIVFGNAILAGLLVQPILFYTTWALCPSLTKNRRGLSWILTTFSAIVLLSLTICELGQMRTTLWSLLGWEAQGSGAASETIFTYWTPSFHNWAGQLGSNLTLQVSPLNPQSYKNLAGEFLRWFISLPIFSLAPLKPTQLYSPTAPYYMGGGGRILFSLENFPRETWFSSVVCGYFVGYCIGDLLLGQLHYRKLIDPASGYAHHIIYTLLVYKLAQHNILSSFLIAGGVLEISTIFLGFSMMFPQYREDFWFPLTFFLARIVFVALMLHEVTFNYPTVTGGPFIYFLALLMHIMWFSNYWKSRQRRMRELKDNRSKESSEQVAKESSSFVDDGGNTVESTTTSASFTKSNSTFQLRVNKEKI